MDKHTYQHIVEQEQTLLMGDMQYHFARKEPFERMQRYIEGLMSNVRRRNGWQLAEQAGEQTPDGMQRLLNTARWNHDGMRDDIRYQVSETLGREDVILVVDETGFLKKGTKSAGVKRQYSGTAGRIENCQIGVFLTYSTPHGHSIIDRELYLPQEWCTDVARRKEAGIPPDVTFQTKGQLAQQMLARAFDERATVDWVTGDSIYGSARTLRVWLEAQHQPFVLGIRSDEALWCGFEQRRAVDMVADADDDDWQRLSAGAGSKGPRCYDWLAMTLPRYQQADDVRHALLVRRSITKPTDLSYYVVFAPAITNLLDWVQVAGRRWTVEESFEHAKDELGLDQYEVRRWDGWYRHMTLVMLGQLLLHRIRRAAVQQEEKK